MTVTTREPVRRFPRPAVATTLSFLWPGLGQWYAGRQRAAFVYAAPLAFVVLLIVVRALSGVEAFAASLLDPSVALTVLVLIAAFAVWRLLSMLDAVAVSGGRRLLRGRTGVLLAALSLVVVVTHGIAGFYAWSFYSAGSKIFVAEPGPDKPTPNPDPSATPDDEYVATPLATPPTERSRITILLTGVDSTADRSHSLTDTMIVVSIDPETNRLSMVSFPRDIAEFPLWDGRTFRGKINSLMTYARNHPDEFPDGPLPSLVRELSFLLGIPIHYYAAVDIDGFRRLIDVVGGITIDNPRRIADARYNWLDGSKPGFFLPAGEQTLDGRTALAFVRSRFGVGDNDFTRAARQQLLLVAVRQKLTDPRYLPQLPAILDVASDTIRTNFPAERIGEMVQLARAIDDEQTKRYVLGPPYSIHPPTNTTGGIYILRLQMERIAALSVELYGEDSAYWTPPPSPTPLPFPLITPRPAPTPSPS